MVFVRFQYMANLIMIYSPFSVFSSVHCSKLLSQGCSSGAPSVTDQTSPVHPPAEKKKRGETQNSTTEKEYCLSKN